MKPMDDWEQLSQRASDVIDVDERTEQRLRDMRWDGKTQKKPLNQEQSMGDEFSA